MTKMLKFGICCTQIFGTFKKCRIYHSYRTIKTMKAWEVLQYGDPEMLLFNTTARMPIITNTKEVLVKVHAASVNPIDVMMLKGYGASVIGIMRQLHHCTFTPPVFPLILGRDFSGTVERVGPDVKDLKHGDEVWGVLGPQQTGSHADYVVTPSCYVTKKPQALNHVEAASIPYAALTAWSALCTFGFMSKDSAFGKRFLVFGASGGVGTMAVQLLKAWGAVVTATCSSDAVEMVRNLGTDNVIDYQMQDLETELKHEKGFDFVLDCVGGHKNLSLSVMKKWYNSKYVSIVSPVLSNVDQNGILFGTAKTLMQAACDTAMGLKDGQSVRWAFFIPNGNALKTIKEMVENRELRPIIDEAFKFENVPEAYKRVLNGHLRGKVVINNMEDSTESDKNTAESQSEDLSLKT